VKKSPSLLVLLLIAVLTLSSLAIVGSAFAQPLPEPSVPEFTAKTVANTIEVTIKNQPLTPYENGSYPSLYYMFKYKDHNERVGFEYYDPVYFVLPSTYGGYYKASDSDFTVVSLSIEGRHFPSGQIDIQAIAHVGNQYPTDMQNGTVYGFEGVVGSWSDIQTISFEETIYIRADGRVEGTDKLQRDGNVYTFSDNINAEITVEIDDIVIDGADYSLQGNGDGVGIHVPNNGNLEIKNIKIHAFKFAIYFDYYSKNCNIISGNTLTNNTHYGIHITNSHNNCIFGNYIEDSGTGIQLVESYNNTIFQNKIVGNGEGIGFGSGGGHSTVFHNLIADNGYAFTFWASSHNTIYGNNLINNTNQVHAWSSSNNWDYESMGNYWSDYNGSDENNDGIGDAPYMITTSPEDYGDADNYPLMEPVDDTIIPEFPSWTPLLIAVVAVVAVAGIYRRRLSKSRGGTNK
jgi:parallel beta-helix repeat protein